MRKYAVINECGDERCGRLEEMRDGALVSFQTVQELAEACLHAVGYCCANNVQLDGPPLTMVRAKLLEIVGRSAPETCPGDGCKGCAGCRRESASPPETLSVLDRLVTVCGACETAACWQGSFMCDSAEMAGIKNLTVRDLHEKPRGENAEYWFKDGDGKIDKTLLEIYQRLTSQNRGGSL